MQVNRPSDPKTIPEALARAARDFRGRGIGIFDNRGRTVEHRTYSELYELATRSAARFAALGVGVREPVLVSLPTSWSWMESWFGVLLCGGWPVAMASPGGMAAAEAQLHKVDKVMERIGARHIVATSTFQDQARAAAYPWARDGVLTSEGLAEIEPKNAFEPVWADPEETAFLQLTSGSTGLPRAVMIPHRAAIHNTLASTEGIGAPHGAAAHAWADSMVAWLPMYHDMGLIGCLMLPMLTGLDVWLLRPTTFLARPRLWLENLGRRGVTFAPAPNFAYQLCVERIRPEELEGVDLSPWRAALTGGRDHDRAGHPRTSVRVPQHHRRHNAPARRLRCN